MALMHKDFTMKYCLRHVHKEGLSLLQLSIKISTPSLVLGRLVSIGLDLYAGLRPTGLSLFRQSVIKRQRKRQLGDGGYWELVSVLLPDC